MRVERWRRWCRAFVALCAAGMLAIAAVVSGCSEPEPPLNGYWVWNYSPSGYVVRVVDTNNYVDTIGVPGNATVERYLRDTHRSV